MKSARSHHVNPSTKAPTLVKLASPPARSIVGTLSRTQTVLQAWGLDIPAA
ncbi:MAG: hypothetical protein ACYCZA_01600 [Thiobacillus sp.]